MHPRVGIIFRALADFFLPRRCVVCGRNLSLKEEYICLYCDADMPLTYDWEREQNKMANRYNERIQEHISQSEPYQRACALFYYDAQAGYKEIPQALKYEGALSMGRFFANRLGVRLAQSPLYEDVDMIIPVPLHRVRRFRRGYNQAEIIARTLARQLGKEDKLCTKLLCRIRATQTQTQLSVEDKRSNVEGAFGLNPKRLPTEPPRHILLVDDVFTTGQTLAQCHKVLRSVFPPTVRISVATLAFVGEG